MNTDDIKRQIIDAIANGKIQATTINIGDTIHHQHNIGKVESGATVNIYSTPAPTEHATPHDDNANARAILAVHQANLCDAAEWAVVVKIMQEQGTMPKANYRNAAEYINDICGTIVTSPESLARSIIFTKVAGTYPNWQIKEDEQSRRTPQKLRKFLQIAQVFINAQNA